VECVTRLNRDVAMSDLQSISPIVIPSVVCGLWSASHTPAPQVMGSTRLYQTPRPVSVDSR
jgi:hypothetical protein